MNIIREQIQQLRGKLGNEIREHDELRNYFLPRIVEPYAQEKTGLAIIPKLERRPKGKPYDARIGSLLFEFERPLTGIGGKDRGKDQASGYIQDFRDRGKEVECFVTDGEVAAHLNKDGEVIEEKDILNMVRTLKELIATHVSRIIEPEDLLDSFAPESDLCQAHGRRLWDLFVEYWDEDSVRNHFNIWKKVYAEASNLNKPAREAVRRYASGFGLEISSEKSEIQKFLFIIQTYISIFMKLLTAKLAIELRAIRINNMRRLLEASDSIVESYEQMNKLPFLKGIFEHDVFGWFMVPCRESREAESKISTVLWNVALTLDKLDVSKVKIDMLRRIYQKFFDKETRKAMGEFYTNEDIVEEVLDSVGYDGEKILNKVLLDPGCGSGTFLVKAIRRFIEKARNEGLSNREILKRITNQIIGIDIHPFAVAMAKINYALAMSNVLGGIKGPGISDLKVPIYWSDSLAEFVAKEADILSGARRVSIKITILDEPLILPDPDVIGWDKVFDLIAKAIEENWRRRRFLEEFPEEVRWMYENTLLDLFDRFKMGEEGKDGRWLPTIKNILAVKGYRRSCDFVVGNPPWIRRRDIEPKLRKRLDEFEFYREAWRPKLDKVKLFVSSRDYSVAFVEAGMGYLKDGGRLGFVITSNVIRSLYAGRMREELLDKCTILRISDYSLSKVELFEGVENVPLIFAFKKSKVSDEHTVDVFMKNGEGAVRSWEIKQDELSLMDDKKSPWIVAPPKIAKSLRKMQKESEMLGNLYPLCMGVKPAAKTVFFVKSVKPTDNPREVLITTEEDKKVRIEKEVVRPFLRGKNVDEWSYNVKNYILWTHDDKTGKVRHELPPRTEEYFKEYEEKLKKRKASSVARSMDRRAPEWIIGDVSEKKLKDKVAWKKIAKKIEATSVPSEVKVEEEKQKLIVDSGVYFIPVEDQKLSLRITGFLNSVPARIFVASYVNRIGQTCQHFAWVLGLVPLPLGVLKDMEFKGKKFSDLVQEIKESKEKKESLLNELDRAVAYAYGLSNEELFAMQDFLKFFTAG